MTDTTNQTPQPCPRHGHRRRGLRRAFLASALVLGGVGLGMARSAVSQGYGPHGGWSDDRPMHDGMGPQQGHHGWGHHQRFGGGMFGPGSVERMVDRLARATDSSSEQKQKMNAIAQRAGTDVLALREKFLAGRAQMRDVLAAPTIDRAKLETLRVEQMKLADDASKRITAAVADIGDVLTPTQRAEFAKHLARHMDGDRAR